MATNTHRSAAAFEQKLANDTAPQQGGTSGSVPSEPTVNRKKQKRRQKQAAKIAAEQSASTSSTGGAQGHKQNGHAPSPTTAYGKHGKPSVVQVDLDYGPSDLDDNYESRDEELFYTVDGSHL